MKLNIITIVLDGEPWIRRHLAEFEKLTDRGIDWKWHIREGAAANTHCTQWCKRQPPRFSIDGTHEYLTSPEIFRHNRIDIAGKLWWDGKVAMFNSAFERIIEPCILMQIDSDELWTADNIERTVQLFTSYPYAQRAYFRCNYYVGPDLITVGSDCYGNNPGEWLRAWRFRPGMMFDSHEPPVLAGNRGEYVSREVTSDMGILFDHMAYATKKQVAYKEHFYGYRGAVQQWERLQKANVSQPTLLKKYLPWVDGKAMVVRVDAGK